MQTTQHKKPLTIWSFIGGILIIYGLIIGIAGIYYIFKPDTKAALYALNPSLWWGGLLLLIGLIFYGVDYKNRTTLKKSE